ncbi:MAG TPA: XrtA/PEP-CTERM system amidotransferase [Candidatus Eisenbacteria bacterium]|nr:XrtA/PEP-CTERM system amidotransferase [Candidatus Eisenbacteria bacterium]
MCGIAGLVEFDFAREPSRPLLEAMNRVQAHRGPDGVGYHVEPGVGFAHRRLSIIDVAAGQQPVYNEDRSVVVTYNGEIYNFQELQRELEGRGHHFRTHCDTEVIVHAWEEWGESCVERFRGMFAFALWDRGRGTFFLARDRLGIKPLHYAFVGDRTLVFGSELKALLLHPGLSRELDPYAIEEYFAFGYIPEPRTILSAVQKLPPGHTLTVRRGAGRSEPVRFWDVPFRSIGPIDAETATRELVERLREAIRIRLISEVPLGAFLSGGVDSSSVVALMAGLEEKPVNTCSIAFRVPGFDESEYALRVAERYHTNHRVEPVDTDDFELVHHLAGVYDEPYADSSAIPTYRVCQLARKHVTVALSGDGGDETLAGYRRYRWHLYEERVRSMMPLALRRPLFGFLGRAYPKADWAPRPLRAKATFQSLSLDSLEGYFRGVAILPDEARRKLLLPAFRRRLGGYSALEVLRRHWNAAPTDDPLSRVQYLDLKTYLPGDILTKVDRASMAHSLEVRVPFLDHPLVEWTSGLPPGLRLSDGEGKHLLKRAMRPYLPDDLLYRTKMGFGVPLTRWFRGPLRETIRQAATGPAIADSGFFDLRFVERLLDEHQSGVRDHSAPLWTLLMFAGSLRHLESSAPVSAEPAPT